MRQTKKKTCRREAERILHIIVERVDKFQGTRPIFRRPTPETGMILINLMVLAIYSF